MITAPAAAPPFGARSVTIRPAPVVTAVLPLTAVRCALMVTLATPGMFTPVFGPTSIG
jgi:hypothetical protein